MAEEELVMRIHIDTNTAQAATSPAAPSDAETAKTITWVRGQLDAARPLSGTSGERYLVEHCGLHPPWPSSLLWADQYQSSPDVPPSPCMIAIITNPTDEIVGVQSIEIDLRTGKKSQRTDNPRLTCGAVGDEAVFLGSTKEHSPTLVLGKDINAVLTRRSLGPCDAYACLGPIRLIEPKPHHRRVEILADTDAREAARRLAREYTKRGLSTFVVTVADSLGPNADLNDALRELGSTAVMMAVEDAERFTQEPGRYGSSQFDLQIGSDIEIARKIVELLEDLYGPIIVCEGRVWRFDKTHWAALDEDHIVRFVHRADGTIYGESSGKIQVVKLNKNRVTSIIDAVLKHRNQPDFFKNPACGINCESGFIQIGDGGAKLMPHARQWRQRHVVRGRWPVNIDPAISERSLLAKFLRDATLGYDPGDPDDAADIERKVDLLGEVVGCAATAHGTRLRNPKAIVTYSPEGGTGKSTYLKLLRGLPNPNAVASVPPSKFGDEKYAHRLIGRVLNASDELSERAVKADVFKKMITGEPVPARDVYRSATDFVPVALHVFSTNVLPAFSGGVDGGVVRRLLPIEFIHVVPEAERDPDLADRILSDEADLFLDFAVQGACRLLRQRDFTLPPSSAKLLNEWILQADPVRAWVAARLEVTSYEHVIAVATLYADFVAWAEAQGLKREFLSSVFSFGKRLRTGASGLQFTRSDGSYCRNVQLRKAA